jgi:hypothetical protein
MATARTLARVSRWMPPLMRMPSRAPREIPAITAVGTEMTRAHEHDTTKMTRPR